jgi:glycolate oxidase iron-sulfur subunit
MASSGQHNLLANLDYSVLQQCMNCGMCLPNCPTFDETLRERNSPRGRIALMRDIADGNLSMNRAIAEEMYFCLGCLACQTSCPAGVNYATLIETARADVEQKQLLSTPPRRFYRWLTLRCLFMNPRLLHAVGWSLWLFQCFGLHQLMRTMRLTQMLPVSLRRLERKTPPIRPPFSATRIAERESSSAPRYRVALLTGCIQDLVYANINRATADVLIRNGCEVITPRSQHCCGSLHAHNGDLAAAKALAKRNIDMFDSAEFDAIITNAGGCGSHLKQYSALLAGEPRYERRAEEWDRKVKDIQEWLVEIDYQVPVVKDAGEALVVTYDDSCHLLHGQRVGTQPLQILRSLPGLRFVPLPEADWCCGSAGIYNITQPVQAEKLLQRKLTHIHATGAAILATANPGCLLQLSQGMAARPSLSHVKVVHPVCLLADAYSRERN